jgi:predicted dehydrogenase
MQFAIVGCGYVADFYLATLANHPDLELVGVYDRDPDRGRRFADFHSRRLYKSYDELLDDKRVELVANLTNPDNHYEVSRRALEAGRDVYSEKPLATRLDDAEALVALAEARDLLLTSAPCSVLGETAQTLWKALRDGRIGMPRLVYAELDDGNVPLMSHQKWVSDSGARWPAKDEFEVGCTLEHAGYYLTWLTTFFGPARRITSFAHVLQPDKRIALDRVTADYATASLEFASGVIGRMTCSLYPPHDHRLRIFGDGGTLGIDASWDYGAPVKLSRRHRFTTRAEKHPALARVVGLGPRRLPLVRKPEFAYKTSGGSNPMDFCRGIAELAAARRDRRAPRLSARWALHVNELVLTMQDPAELGTQREIRTDFAPMEPMPWAR